jgi:endonuclease/exonuclease/phosphatase family metal-dependent hydrolase
MRRFVSILLLPLSLQASMAKAPLFYPETFSIELTQKDLKEVASETFRTHLSKKSEVAHLLTEQLVLLPFYAFIHAQSYCVQSCPGAGKETPSWQAKIIKITAATSSALTFFPGFHSLLLGLTLRALTHTDRPFVQYLRSSDEKRSIALSEGSPFHIATHNVSLTPSSVNIKMDLRPPMERAHELAEALLEDPHPPALLMIEEGWHEGALKVLCTRLQKTYPHILHSVAPGFWGMSSGIAFFSKHEIEDIKYVRFEKMPFPHNLPLRGFLRVRLATEKGPLYVYGGVHTHSMCDCEGAELRKAQLKQLTQAVSDDALKNPACLQIVMGDLNTTPVDLFGHDHQNQPEGEVWRGLQQDFEDLFLRDHDVWGNRNRSTAHFLALDNARMGLSLDEPCASWYDGPFLREPERGAILSQMREDLEKHDVDFPVIAAGKGISKEPSWGTTRWFEEQMAVNARYDAILLPHGSALTGYAEIRRIVMKAGSVSAASDHLPVHALIWLNEQDQ